MTPDAEEILRCIMGCEISLYTSSYGPDKAVVPISNLLHLKPGWTKYRMRKVLKELRKLEIIEYTSQGCPDIISYGGESYPELIEEARPPTNGYALTSKAFNSDLWKQMYNNWTKSIEDWANSRRSDYDNT